MVLAIEEEILPEVVQILEANGEKAYLIGRVKEGEGITFGGGEIR